MVSFAKLVGAGGGPVGGSGLGQKDRKQGESILGKSVSLLIILAIALTIIFQLIKKPFLFMFGASEATYVYAGQYLAIYLCGTIFVMFSAGLNSYITVQGASVTAMCSVLIGAVMNLVLDPIFIFVFHMGVKGAAVATILAQASSAIWILYFLTSEKATLKIKAKNLKLDVDIIARITALGISPFIMGATESLISIVFNSGAQKYGNDLYVGSITILQSCMQMISTPLNGFTTGVQPIISYNYGANNLDRVKKTCLSLIAITFTFSASLCAVALFVPEVIAGLFTTDVSLIALCEEVMPVFICGLLVFGVQCGSQSSFMALGKAKQSLFFALFRKVILLTPLALILPATMHSVMGIYYAEPISDTISAISCFLVFLWTLKKIMKGDKA